MSSDRIRDIWGPRTPYTAGTPWPERVDQFLIDGVGGAVRTTAQLDWLRMRMKAAAPRTPLVAG